MALFFSIKHKLIVLFLGLIALGLVAIGAVSFEVMERAAVDNALHTMEGMVEAKVHELDAFQQRARDHLLMSVSHENFRDYFALPEVREGNRHEADGRLLRSLRQEEMARRLETWTQLVQRHFPVAEACLIDNSGQEHIRITQGSPAPVEDFSREEHHHAFFTPTLALPAGGVHVSQPYMSPDIKRWVMSYTTPVVFPDGTKPAFYHFEIALDHVQEFIKVPTATDEMETTRLLLLDPGSGLVIADSILPIQLGLKPGADPDDPQNLAQYLPHASKLFPGGGFSPLLIQMKRESSGRGEFSHQGSQHYMAFKRLPGTGWTLAAVKSYAGLLEGGVSLLEIRHRLTLIVLAVLSLSAGLIWWMAGRITASLQQTVQAMSRVAQGDLTQHVPAARFGRDELGLMADSFNLMSRRLLETHSGLEEERNKLMTIILSAKEGIVVTNRTGEVVLVNPAAERILEKDFDQIHEEGLVNLLDDPEYIQVFLSTEGREMPETVVYKGRVIHFYAATIRASEAEGDEGIIGSAALLRDVTEERKLQNLLMQLSYSDELTGLFNRRRMEELLKGEFERARRYCLPLSVLFFDVDHFKQFNDTYGHDMGDQVLRMIGRTSRDHFRTVDACCRYGGEEFCILLPNTGPEGTEIAANRFRERIAATPVDGLKVTISIGAVSFPQSGGKNGEEFLKKADTALYAAKRGGRNRVEFWRDEAKTPSS
ncbi:MAG: diguanylate cyclase [Magnetococcales bacterium]|nr:diguanylate cyclase [Magnetococcales bacterium]